MSLNTQTDAYNPCRALKEHELLMLKKARKFSYENSTILDIGCADGLFISEVAKELPKALITGIDISSKLIDIAKAKKCQNCTFLVEDAEKFEPNKKFDLIITLHSLEHLPNVKIFKKFKEILTTDGTIFFEVPNCTKDYFNGRAYDSPHLLFFTKKSFDKLSELYGLKIVNFTESSYSFNEDHKFQRISQNAYLQINSKKLLSTKFKFILRKILPKFLINFFKNILNIFFKNKQSMILNSFYNNSGDNCYIRGLIKKN